MNAWTLAAIALCPPLAAIIAAACRGSVMHRLVALQLATSLTCLILIAMTFAFDQSAFIDLPLALALLSLPGAMAMAMFLERWL